MNEDELIDIIQRQKQTILFYQEGIENGTIIQLPCEMGTDMWFVFKPKTKWRVRKTRLSWETAERAIQGFGQTFFLTEEQAKDKSDELNGVINTSYFRSN